jgi:hypothetical protein
MKIELVPEVALPRRAISLLPAGGDAENASAPPAQATRLWRLGRSCRTTTRTCCKPCSGAKPILTITAGSPSSAWRKSMPGESKRWRKSCCRCLDGFDLALAASPTIRPCRNTAKGVEIIRKQLWDVLAKQGIERIDALGKPFNPHLHHAIESVETSEYPDGTVTQVLQQGYIFHDRVLRPAMVKVSSHSESAASGKG